MLLRISTKKYFNITAIYLNKNKMSSITGTGSVTI